MRLTEVNDTCAANLHIAPSLSPTTASLCSRLQAGLATVRTALVKNANGSCNFALNTSTPTPACTKSRKSKACEASEGRHALDRGKRHMRSQSTHRTLSIPDYCFALQQTPGRTCYSAHGACEECKRVMQLCIEHVDTRTCMHGVSQIEGLRRL